MRGSKRGAQRTHSMDRAPTGGTRALAATLAAALLLTLGACAQPTRRAAPLGPDAATGSPAGAPRWSRQPNSWGKLDEIERWLQGPAAANADPYWRVEAELQLAEGRLAFAGAEREQDTNPDTLAFRRQGAREGFDAVLAMSGSATSSQMTRARNGAMRLSKLGTIVPAAAATNLPIAGLVPRARWKAAAADPRNMRRASGRWNWITVHHSVFSADGNDLEASLETVRRIQREHRNGRGYADIGYHFLIDRAGRVIEGRSLAWQGAHAGGQNNVGNVGICLLGNFETEHPTPAALRSLERLIVELQRELHIPRRNVRPHRAWKETDCPGQNLMPWFARY